MGRLRGRAGAASGLHKPQTIRQRRRAIVWAKKDAASGDQQAGGHGQPMAQSVHITECDNESGNSSPARMNGSIVN